MLPLSLIPEKYAPPTDAEPPLINGKECPISMTFGVVQYLKGESLDDCIGRADAAMYQGKPRWQESDCLIRIDKSARASFFSKLKHHSQPV